MSTIHISVTGTAAALSEQVALTAGNAHTIVFAFDSSWAGRAVKCARIRYGGRYTDLQIVGNTVTAPAIDELSFSVGVIYGDSVSTTAVELKQTPSVRTGGGAPASPTPSMYARLVAMIEAGLLKGEKGDPGTTLHSELSDRSAAGQHPISAVTGLSEALAARESSQNKVTALSQSSTDTQYPSAKCVYDLIGNVEALLEGVL